MAGVNGYDTKKKPDGTQITDQTRKAWAGIYIFAAIVCAVLRDWDAMAFCILLMNLWMMSRKDAA